MNEAARQILARGAEQLGLQLTASQMDLFAFFAAELKKWGKKINLTAIKGDADIAAKHFVDSLTLVNVLSGSGRLLDIGSGGGFPAIPLKIVLPRLEIVSVDAVEKKVIFQRHAARILGLEGFQAIHARVEQLPETYGRHFDWVVSRAFSDLSTFVRLGLPLAKETGALVAMKGRGGREEAEEIEEALAHSGAIIRDVSEFVLPGSGDARSLVVICRKTA